MTRSALAPLIETMPQLATQIAEVGVACMVGIGSQNDWPAMNIPTWLPFLLLTMVVLGTLVVLLVVSSDLSVDVGSPRQVP